MNTKKHKQQPFTSICRCEGSSNACTVGVNYIDSKGQRSFDWTNNFVKGKNYEENLENDRFLKFPNS